MPQVLQQCWSSICRHRHQSHVSTSCLHVFLNVRKKRKAKIFFSNCLQNPVAWVYLLATSFLSFSFPGSYGLSITTRCPLLVRAAQTLSRRSASPAPPRRKRRGSLRLVALRTSRAGKLKRALRCRTVRGRSEQRRKSEQPSISGSSTCTSERIRWVYVSEWVLWLKRY